MRCVLDRHPEPGSQSGRQVRRHDPGTWAEGTTEVAPAPRKKRTSRKRRSNGGPPAEPAASAGAEAQRRARAAELPGCRAAAAAGEPQPGAGTRRARPAVPPAPPPAQLRREQARLRRAALIADQLGDRDLPLYLVDFMVVEDAAVELGFERAVETVARREGREPTELEEAWHRAVERIASDESLPLRRRAAAVHREDRRRPHRGGRRALDRPLLAS